MDFSGHQNEFLRSSKGKTIASEKAIGSLVCWIANNVVSAYGLFTIASEPYAPHAFREGDCGLGR